MKSKISPAGRLFRNCFESLRIIFFLSMLIIFSTNVHAGPEVDRIGTFNGTTLWLGYNFSFSDTYAPECETYNWMLYIAPEGLYVGLTSVRSVYSAVDVNAGGGLFYGSWAIPSSKLTVAGSGQPAGYPYITWSKMGSISGVTITKVPFPTSLPVSGPLSGLGIGMSMGPTFFREGSSSALQAALQLNTIMSVSFALVPMPSFIPSVTLDLSGPGDTDLTGKDTGFYPVVLWSTPITMAEITAKGTVQAVVDKLNASAASQGESSLNGETEIMLASFFSELLSANSTNGQKISRFIDSRVIPGAASSPEIEQLISKAEDWLQTDNNDQEAAKLGELMAQQPFDFPALYKEMKTLGSGVGLGFQVAYRNGYQWAVDNGTREDDILYIDGIETVYCAAGSNCSVVVETKEIYQALGLTYPQNPEDDIFELEDINFSASMESMLANVNNIGTEDVVTLLNYKAEHNISQNSGIAQLLNVSFYLDLNEPKYQGIQYKKINLKSRKIYFLSAQQSVRPGESVGITPAADISFPVGQQIQWVQKFGPQVQLSAANTKTPSFTAPHIGPESQLLVFDLKVGSTTYPNAAVIQVERPALATKSSVKFNIEEYLADVVSVGDSLLVVDISNQNFRKISNGQQVATITPTPAMTAYPFGATFYNNKVYYTFYLGNTVYSMNANGTGNAKVFTTPFSGTTGICHDGTSFWIADQNSTPARIHKLSGTGSSITSFVSPVATPAGMTFDGADLWVADQYDQKICRISTSGNLLECFDSPGTQPTGVEFDQNGTLWSVDLDYATLYQHISYPTADAGADQAVNEGRTVYLNGAASSASDGGGLTFQWIQEQGPQVVLTGSGSAAPSFIAPNVDSATSLSFKLVITDSSALSSSQNCRVTVNNTGLALQAVPGTPQIAIASSIVTLDGSASTGAVKNYTWKQHRGPSVELTSPLSATTTFAASAVTEETSLVFELIVENSAGLKSSQLVDVTVLPANLAGVIQLLQLLSGSPVELFAQYDFNGDGKIGLEDVLHIMRSL